MIYPVVYDSDALKFSYQYCFFWVETRYFIYELWSLSQQIYRYISLNLSIQERLLQPPKYYNSL